MKKRLAALAAVLGIALGIYAGTAAADDATQYQCSHFVNGVSSYAYYPSGVNGEPPYFEPCYLVQYHTAAALTVKGTHSWSDVVYYVVFYDSTPSGYQYMGSTAQHEAKGLAWGPGFNWMSGADAYVYWVFNATFNTDAYLGHK